MVTYEKICTTKLSPVAKDWMNAHRGTFTEKDMEDAVDQTANALKIGIGKWCRTMTKIFKETIAE